MSFSNGNFTSITKSRFPFPIFPQEHFMPITIISATQAHQREAAHLIYDSTNAWYQKNRGFSVFTGEKDSALLFCRTYAALDGQENHLIAWDSDAQRIAGSCFVHPRPTHISLGIMNVHPDYFGQSVAPRILEHIIEIAQSQNLPLHLVSSAMNLDSFSLYSRMGFVPHTVFQDMMFPNFDSQKVSKMLSRNVSRLLPSVRPAQLADVPAITALDLELTGRDHTADFTYFIQNPDGAWRTWVLETETGLTGVLSSVCDPGSCMLGPGFMRDEDSMLALIFTAYRAFTEPQDALPAARPIFLVPCAAQNAIRTLYSWGARNTELHVGQTLGGGAPAKGLVMPTFMPES
ncbi:MAG: GNAT family N-acetyltransferase [Planctomycetaceae bacterium]|nr:GNAT family N-acetyltransferase [Planctomycetaceae bacterium]